ncbi:MAG: DUF302 domain-containing protein [Rhodospirillaceae bacterium]|jgi:uncharacterized protein (DUF302 family)|nr:DUF302 domain-containing protein [Rhodospirillaceae bacterium]
MFRSTLLALAACFALTGPVAAADWPQSGMREHATELPFRTLWDRLEAAIEANGMGIVARASATAGAKALGIEIPGNAVVMVFRADYAVRMLKASVPAGIEAPLRFYLTEDPASGRATLTYRLPSQVFAPYGSTDLDIMAKELDGVFETIAAQAIAPNAATE